MKTPPTTSEIAAYARREARRAMAVARVNPAQALEIEQAAAAEVQRMLDAQSAARDAEILARRAAILRMACPCSSCDQMRAL